jgi:putative DNA primase/helicase
MKGWKMSRLTFSEIIDRLGGGTPSGDGYVTLCPAHEDSNPSLVLTLKDDGRVLMHCRSQGCSFSDVVAALGMVASDFVEVEAGGMNFSSGAATKMPPTAAHLSWLNNFIDLAASQFFNSPAAEYAEKRWGITPLMALELRLGYTDETVAGDFIPRPWNTSPRITVPLFGFDKMPRGLQGRALRDNDPTRWCSLSNPLDTAWSRLGVFAHDHGDDYVQLGEGPGDALTAYAAGTSSVFLRGTSLAMGAVNQIIAGCSGKVVILAGDADVAGQNFNHNLGEALIGAGIETRTLNLTMPEHGDVTEWREDDPSGFGLDYSLALRSAPLFEIQTETPQQPVAENDSTYLFTEDGNAQRLIKKMGGTLGYCPQIGRMVYADGHWKVDELHQSEKSFSEMTYEMLHEGDDLIERGTRSDNPLLIDRGTRLKGWAVRSQNSPVFPNSIKRADQMISFPMSRLDTRPYLLNVKNGTLDLRTGELKDHDPSDWITHLIDIEYNPHAECPRWDKFLHEIFPGEPEMPPYIKRIAGYAATGEVRESCLICSVGIGANGKSILWGTIEHVLGDLAGSVPFSAFEKKSSGSSTADLAYLRGKRLAMVQEGEANTLLAESTIKRATSGSDSISARHLYKSPMKFYPEFLIVMATNSLPRIRGADEGIWRRIRLLRFKRFFEDWERDPYLFETLKSEREGILRWIVEGAKEWYADGLCDPDSVRESTKNYRHTADELAGFIGQVIEEDPNGSIAGSELMELYMDWTVEENVRSWSRRALYEAVCERVHGVEKVKKKDGVHLLGVQKVTK